MNYAAIKDLAKMTGLPITTLIPLAPNNDPFYAGTPTDIAVGQWFAELWNRFRYGTGVHIRRIHYQIVSQQPPVLMPNGQPYENTEKCWDFLSNASKMARYLGYVDAGSFVDRRNPEPRIYTNWTDEQPSIQIAGDLWDGTHTLPAFPDLPYLWVSGFTGQQRYHVEIWAEKSTMNDVLIPLCQRYGVNLVTGVGEMSITSVLSLANRFKEDKPVRIFYVSDFDPAGQSMPVAVARKIEYFQREQGYDADVRLYPIILTMDQVRSYRLPRTPIKETERRAGRFEDRFGSGAVELDALEALYPGRLETIITDEIRRYHDSRLYDRVHSAQRDLYKDLSDIQDDIAELHDEELEALRDEYAALKERFDESFTGYREKLVALWQTMREELVDKTPDIGNYEIPEAETAVEKPDPLYDSTLDYLEQVNVYKVFQGKPTNDFNGDQQAELLQD